MGAGRVSDDAEPSSSRHLGDVLHDLRAERVRFLGRGGHIVHHHVGEPCRRCTRSGVLHHAAAGSLPWIHHCIGAHVPHLHILELPAEQLAVKVLGFLEVGGVELYMNKWIWHGLLPSALSERGLQDYAIASAKKRSSPLCPARRVWSPTLMKGFCLQATLKGLNTLDPGGLHESCCESRLPSHQVGCFPNEENLNVVPGLRQGEAMHEWK